MHFDSKEIMKILKISKQSLYYRRTNNLIKFKKINNKYFYELDNYEYSVPRVNIIYCRVSNTKQKLDLDNQEKIMKKSTKRKLIIGSIITGLIGSYLVWKSWNDFNKSLSISLNNIDFSNYDEPSDSTMHNARS